MAEKFQNKYRIDSARAYWWDYSKNGTYFITICTLNKECFFGQIESGECRLNECGKIASQLWIDITLQFPYAELDTFVVMPNHMHGLIKINKYGCTQTKLNVADSKVQLTEQSMKTGGATGQNNPMLHDNISRIIRWYKGRTSFECRKLNPYFNWQARFYNRIIFDNYTKIIAQRYIENNPRSWEEDPLYI